MDRDEDLVGSARTATGRDDAVAGKPGDSGAERAAPLAGGAAGAVAGGTAGTLVAGPIGTVIGAIAGAIGGWWAGAGARQGAEIEPHEDVWYRRHYEAATHRGPAWEYARPAYQLGHTAAANPEYRGRPFNEVERDLQHGWRGETRATYGDWSAIRELARAAYERRSQAGTLSHVDDIGTTETHQRAPFSDPLPDASDLAGSGGHPGIGGGPGDIPDPSTASRAAQPLPRPDMGPHSTDATGESARSAT